MSRSIARTVWRGVVVAVTGLLAGCLFADVGAGGGGPGGGSAAKGSSDGGLADGATGTECTVTTSTSGLKLCEGISACPQVMVNQGIWMGCGFVLAKGTFNLECECTGYLCGVGASATCAEATALLQQKSASEVCAQLNNGIADCNFEGLSGTSH